MNAQPDFPREQLARQCLSALYGFEFAGESLCDEAERIFSQPNPRAVKAVGFADQIEDFLRSQGVIGSANWRCFHCDEAFTDRRLAAAHFGVSEEQVPACRLKASEGGLLETLRETEDALFAATAALHAESAEGLQAYRANLSRHATALRAAEEAGYARGLHDRATEDAA